MKKDAKKTKLVKATDTKKSVKPDTKKSVKFDLPKVPKTWALVKKVKMNKVQKVELDTLKEFKGFQVWFAPFKTPQKPFRVKPGHDFFVIDIVTWSRKFLVRASNVKVLNIVEIG